MGGGGGGWTCDQLRSGSFPTLVPPVVEAGPVELSVPEGLQVLLPCAVRGIPEPRITWSKDGAVVRGDNGKFTFLQSGELIVKDAQVSLPCRATRA